MLFTVFQVWSFIFFISVLFILAAALCTLVVKKVLDFPKVFSFITKTLGILVLFRSKTECYFLDRIFFDQEIQEQVELDRKKDREVVYDRLEGYDYYIASIYIVRIMLQLVWPYLRDFPYNDL